MKQLLRIIIKNNPILQMTTTKRNYKKALVNK